MRLFTLIVGILLSIGFFIQAFLVTGVSSAFGDEGGSTAGALGVLGALLLLVGSALVIGLPLASTIVFGLAALLLFAATGSFGGDYGDLQFWAWLALLLAVSAFFGWRGKKKADAEKLEEKMRQRQRDELLEEMVRKQSS